MSFGAPPGLRYRCLGLALLLTLLASASAVAQAGRPQYDVAELQRKVQRSAELQRQALQSLADPRKAEGLVRQAWTELRAAQHGMILNASSAKFVDPLFEMNNRRAEQALGHLQVAGDVLERQKGVTSPRAEQEEGASAASSYVDGVRQHLEQAVRLTNGLTL
jgi:hypothetical protein